MSFALHPQLMADCIYLGDLPHCRVLLMNNQHFPWVILVPRVEGASEIFDLPTPIRAAVQEEVAHTAQLLKESFGADKMNIAALGNQVPQLHIHVIARFREDVAWPNPVWGKGGAVYATEALEAITANLKKLFGFTVTA